MSFSLPFPNLTPPGTDADVTQVVANFAAITSEFNSQTFAGLATVFQATDAAYGLSPTNTGAQNDAALQAAIAAALAGAGGIIFIPQGTYQFTNGVTITGTKKGLIIQGSGAYTQLMQQNNGNNIFTITSFANGGHDGAGLRIRNLWFEYPQSSSGAAGVAISMANVQNITAEECIFWNCPGVMIDDTSSLQSGLKDCTIYNNIAANSTQLVFNGNEDFCHNTILLGAGGGSVAGQVALQLVGTKEFYCDNCQISQFINSVVITTGGRGPATLGAYFSNCFLTAYNNCVNIVPDTSGHTIQDVFFTSCRFQSVNAVSGSNGCYIDTLGGTNTNVQGIHFTSCSFVGWGDAGIQVKVASNVQVNGCWCSSNGLNPSAVANGAGIALTGACDNIRIQNSILDGINQFSGSTQPYGVALSGGCTDVWITANSIFGNQTLPIYLNGQGQHCFAKDNRGYNNINTVVASAAPFTSTTWFDALGYGSITPSAWTVPFLGDYLISAVGTGIFASYISHDRADLTKVNIGVTGSVLCHMNAQQSMRLDFTGPASAIVFNILGQ